MTTTELPNGTADVLEIPEGHMTEVFAELVAQRRLSSLVSEIHKDLWSSDPDRKIRSKSALRRLGFPE